MTNTQTQPTAGYLRLANSDPAVNSSPDSNAETSHPPFTHSPAAPRKRRRERMTGQQRREQLIQVGRTLFAEKGYESVTIEEIAAKAEVSKPVVYEHFGGKDGLFAVIVDREVTRLLSVMTTSLNAGHARELLEQAGLAFFNYIESNADGFRILIRDTPVATVGGSFEGLMEDITVKAELIVKREFEQRGFPTKHVPMYTTMVLGQIITTGRWWLDVRKPKKEEVVAHLVNMLWRGFSGLEPKPKLHASTKKHLS